MTLYPNLNFINFTLDHLLCIIGVIVSILDSRAEDRGFEASSDQTINYKIDICCFSDKHTALWSKSNYWLAWNQNNVSEWRDISIHGLMFLWSSTIEIQLS